MQLSFITGNSNKLNEFRQILGSDIELEQLNIDLPEIQEIDARKVVEAKLKEAVKHTGNIVIVEDTGLFFNAWNNLPGVFIKWFLNTVGNDGITRMLEPFDDKTAYAQVIVGLASRDIEPVFFEGRVDGRIIPPRGKSNFGWDPIFIPGNSDKTYGEMDKDEKNNISMRYIAVRKLKDYIENGKNRL